MEKFILEELPGVCSQDDFDHDFALLIERIRDCSLHKHSVIPYVLLQLALEKGYALNWPEKSK